MIPIIAAGSVLFGIWLVVMPRFFVNTFMYILGALLIIAGIQQIASLIRARKWSHVPYGFYVMPVIILIIGVMILVYPFQVATNTFIIFGVASLLYGIIEFINWYKFRPGKIKQDNLVNEEIIEVTPIIEDRYDEDL